MSEQCSYADFSDVHLPIESFDLGEGLILRKTYAHLMSPHVMAFARPAESGFHPSPWHTAKGGLEYDITIELTVPHGLSSAIELSVEDTAWWIAALLRIVGHPYLSLPVISNYPFSQIPGLDVEPDLNPLEIIPRFIRPVGDNIRVLASAELSWVRSKWQAGVGLLKQDAAFFSAFRAFDFCTLQGKRSLSLLSVWTGLEQLFSPSPGELRYRVSSNIAAYLEPPGEKRHALFKKMLKLYDMRSKAAHTWSEIETEPLVQSFVIMRNALTRMIDEELIPTQEILEKRLFGVV